MSLLSISTLGVESDLVCPLPLHTQHNTVSAAQTQLYSHLYDPEHIHVHKQSKG
jgi:hypothetical protein